MSNEPHILSKEPYFLSKEPDFYQQSPMFCRHVHSLPVCDSVCCSVLHPISDSLSLQNDIWALSSGVLQCNAEPYVLSSCSLSSSLHPSQPLSFLLHLFFSLACIRVPYILSNTPSFHHRSPIYVPSNEPSIPSKGPNIPSKQPYVVSLLYTLQRDSSMCVTWLVHMCNMTRRYVPHNSFMNNERHTATHSNTLQHSATHCNSTVSQTEPAKLNTIVIGTHVLVRRSCVPISLCGCCGGICSRCVCFTACVAVYVTMCVAVCGVVCVAHLPLRLLRRHLQQVCMCCSVCCSVCPSAFAVAAAASAAGVYVLQRVLQYMLQCELQYVL